ncbi:MAG: putative TonB-dependent receptor [Alphaproteobacteria bacterium MarineAlpha8_Bin1]|nr:MAG: putative TonB-dependent receptor [Alphaproteobacteria bacterium MarineAlpha8_Bin1]
MFKIPFFLLVLALFTKNVSAQNKETIFTVPNVFITSKIKPSQNFESDRGNILFEAHDIEQNKQYSIGDMLKDLPGVSSQGLGVASRPIIRGMNNSRVKILQNSGFLSDVSEFGEDHIVGYDPMLIDKIEIIKGPGTLLYGNNGFAGVVNIINPLIPVDKPISDQDVEANFGYQTSGGELKTALKFGKSISNYTVRGSGSFLSSGPYDLANSSTEQPNSSKFMTSGGIGLTYNDGENYIGVSLDKLEAVYSLPGAEGEENLTSLNPTRNSINFKSSLALDNKFFKKLNFDGTVSEYSHAERTTSGNNHNIEFFNDAYEFKTSLNHKSLISQNEDGLIGFHFQNKNQGAEGAEESHLTSTKTNSFALFILENFKFNYFDLDIGGRIESVNLKNTTYERGFFPGAFSSTLKKELFTNNTAFFGFDFTQRAPNVVELFSEGPHHALENFENGDANLDVETSYNISLGYNYNENLNKLKIETYFNYINDFIAADRDGTTVDVEGEDFNNVVHLQYDAIFTGIELSGQYNFAKYQNFDFLTNFMVDFLKGYRPRDSLNDKAISRIPQSKLNVGLQAKSDDWDAELSYYHYFDKDFLGPFQTRTGGHSRLDFNLTKDFSYSNVSGHLMFGAKNILDVVGRNHLESKKSQVQLPGRSFIFMVKVFY